MHCMQSSHLNNFINFIRIQAIIWTGKRMEPALKVPLYAQMEK